MSYSHFFEDLNCPEKSTTCVPKCGDDVKSFQNVSSQLLCAGRDFVKLRRGSGKDRQGMAPKAKGLKA